MNGQNTVDKEKYLLLKKSRIQETLNLSTDADSSTNTKKEKDKYIFAGVSFSKHRPSGSMLSISRNVCMSVCSLLRYRLTVFLPPLPGVGCPIFLYIQNPWGKVMERNGFTFEHFNLEVV